MNASHHNPSETAALAARDLAVLWHPCTQMKDHETQPLIAIRRGQGAWLEDFDGRRYLDAVSSWWVNLFGHANPRINAAVHDQLERLEHVIFAGFTHEPAVRLAERLVEITPAGLNRCFFADNGSAAVEVALKRRARPASSPSPTAITARPWARWRSATWSSTSRSTSRC